jgi:peptidoglycan-N-acetylglucosamine deacetylase
MKLVSSALDTSGKVLSRTDVPASFVLRRHTSVLTRFLPSDARVRPGKWRWMAASRAPSENCAPPGQPPCEDRFPSDGFRSITVRIPRPKSCRAAGSPYRLHGPRARKQIALTFDDGPSPYTSPILRVLDRLDAKATFFVLGDRIAGRQGMLRRILREGHELANHSWNHAVLAAGGSRANNQIRHTNAVIRSATGFTPCLFRAPYGAVSSSLVAEARSAGLTTVEWDVDPRDWGTPGAGTIFSRVVGSARSGSIVVMHDGGGPRGQTIQAVAAIIKRLRARGYELVTVSQLLGFKQLYR